MSKIILTQRYDFAFVHKFTDCDPLKQSNNLHGHSAKIEVSVNCTDSFFCRDFMNTEVQKVLNFYNNKLLNDFLDKVSCEYLISFLYNKLKQGALGPFLTSLGVQETQKNYIYISQ